MDIGNKFTLVDFLAYLFPGIVSALGLFVLLLRTPLKRLLFPISPDWATGVLVLVVSYVLGVLLSGFAEIAVKRINRMMRHQWSRASISPKAFEAEIRAAFDALVDKPQSAWSAENFYVCRSLVFQVMPAVAPFIQRQGSLRELRMNLLPAITVWLVAGLVWGGWAFGHGLLGWGYALTIGSTVSWIVVGGVLVDRMNRNEAREVREVFTAFLAGYKSGLFDKAKD